MFFLVFLDDGCGIVPQKKKRPIFSGVSFCSVEIYFTESTSMSNTSVENGGM